MKFSASSSFFSKYLNDSCILLKRNYDYFYELNDTAGFLWKNIQTPKTVNDLIKSLLSEYSLDAKKAKTDVEDFLKDGVKIGFITKKITR